MLRADSIVLRYRRRGGWITVLDKVSIDLSPGARLGLVGPSACGKSSLAQVLALLREPDAGTVTIDGETVTGWRTAAPKALRRRVQLMWQSPRLASDPRMCLREIILEPLAANGLLPRDRDEQVALLRRWTDRVGLTDELFERRPHEVSDGQLQRACLARALILEPRYLICDEISSMLDVSTQAALLQVIASEQERRDMGVLLISHDRVLVEYWCHDVKRLTPARHAPGTPTTTSDDRDRPHALPPGPVR